MPAKYKAKNPMVDDEAAGSGDDSCSEGGCLSEDSHDRDFIDSAGADDNFDESDHLEVVLD